ncbi:MAG: RNA polymerase sigma factor [Brevinema sp.]
MVKDEVISEVEIQVIINKILQGETQYFEVIYDLYYKMIVSIIRRIVRPDSAEIDAIVNEAFLIVFRSLKGFKGNSKFSTYIYRIVLNFAFKVSKKKSREKKYFVGLGNEEENTIENISSGENTDEIIINRNIVENAIGKLNKDLQEAVDLYYYERYSIKEIAHIMGTTETAIKNRLYQARFKIKTELNKEAIL